MRKRSDEVPCPHCGNKMMPILVLNRCRGYEVRLWCMKCNRIYRLIECDQEDLIGLEN